MTHGLTQEYYTLTKDYLTADLMEQKMFGSFPTIVKLPRTYG